MAYSPVQPSDANKGKIKKPTKPEKKGSQLDLQNIIKIHQEYKNENEERRKSE